MDHGKELHQSDLTGALHMGAAAGTDVASRNRHDPHRPGQLLFAPVFHGVQLILFRIYSGYLQILPDHSIGLFFNGHQIPPLQNSVEIDGHLIGPHMKAHVVIAEPLVDQAGYQVLSRVLLHMLESPVPVDDASDHLAHRQRAVRIVDHLAVLFMDIRYPDISQEPCIRRLAAALRVKRRGREGDLPSLFPLLAGKDLGFKFLYIRRIIIQLVHWNCLLVQFNQFPLYHVLPSFSIITPGKFSWIFKITGNYDKQAHIS